MRAGDTLRVICTDPGSVYDIPAFARQWKHEIVAEDHHDQGRHVFVLRKGGT